MAKRYGTTGEIVGKRVLLDKSTPKKPEAVKRLGKVRHCVFHPTQRRFVGFIVKRPDLLWMFRRKDVFVAYNGYDVVDGRIVVSQAPEATGKGACKAMGVNYDDCVLWAGLPVMGEDGTVYGTVGDVSFDPMTGEVRSLTVTQGATANALLGVREIPGHLIRGFKRGIGTAHSVNGQDEGEELWRRMQSLADQDNQNRQYVAAEREELDPLARIGTDGGLEDTLLLHLSRQLERSQAPTLVLRGAQFLAACLDESGYLREEVENLAQAA